MKKLAILLLLQVGLLTFAQYPFVSVDMAAIRDSLTNPALGPDYQTLFKRFEALDTTLTNADYRLIYYGFSLDKDYSGYTPNRSGEIREFWEMGKTKNYKKAMAICDEVLKKAPVDLDANFNKLITMKHIDKDDPEIAKFRYRYRRLVDAVTGSGDGLTCETGFKVMYISDEYHIMYNYLEIEKMLMQSLVGDCDKMTTNPGKYFPQSEIYFDITVPFESLGKMFKSETGN